MGGAIVGVDDVGGPGEQGSIDLPILPPKLRQFVDRHLSSTPELIVDEPLASQVFPSLFVLWHLSSVDPYKRMLVVLKIGVVNWLPWLKKATHASEAMVENIRPNGDFFLVVRWRNLDGTKGEYRKLFDRTVLKEKRTKCPGDYLRAVAREILELRGV